MSQIQNTSKINTFTKPIDIFQFQYFIFASAICLTFAYPGYEQHYGNEHELQSEGGGGGYESYDGGDYGHQIARISHGEHEHHGYEGHHEDEHVDYYVSICILF